MSSKVARATGIVAVMTLLSRVLGMLRDMAIAITFGASGLSDAFLVAFRIPNLLRRVVAEGALASAFVPIFAEERTNGIKAAQECFSGALALVLLLTVPFTALGILYADEIIRVISPGFGTENEKAHLAAQLLVVMLPYSILIAIVAIISSALNSLGAFAVPALPPILLNISMICSLLVGLTAAPVIGLSYAVLLGGAVGVLVVSLKFYSLGFTLTLSNPFTNRSTRKLFVLFLPAMLSASLHQVIVFINSLLASTLNEGSISYLYYADRIFQFPLGVFSLALATAALPRLSELSTSGDDDRLSEELSRFLCWITFITVPAAAALIALAHPITELLYERGTFTPRMTQMTASALAAYAVGLWTISAHSVVVRAFLAKGDTRTPSIVSLIAIVLNLILALALMGTPQVRLTDRWNLLIFDSQQLLHIASLGPTGVVLAGSLATFFSLYALVLLLRRINISCYFEDIMPPIVKCIIASTVMVGALKLILRFDLSPLLTILISAPVGAALYFACTSALGLPYARTVIQQVGSRLQSRSQM